MTEINQWLLPDGIEDVLPEQASKMESLRRQALDLYHSWGYDLVIPPLAEFAESLLSGTGSDLDLMTFKLTDQVSGRTMGVRADMTPQTSRMDAHSLQRKGPSRLCYVGPVLYTRPRHPLESRSPIQIGVELYGETGLAADIEVIRLMMETLGLVGLRNIRLDLGHVGIYQSLLEGLNLSNQQEKELFNLVQSKSVPQLNNWIDLNIKNQSHSKMIRSLVGLVGDISILDNARKVLSNAPAEVELALDELQSVASALIQSSPGLELCFDLSELRGYHYHTGLVFAVYTSGEGQAIGNGGRYDHVGKSFGRSRPATGFNMSLKTLVQFNKNKEYVVSGIFAPSSNREDQHAVIKELRLSGNRVVIGFQGQDPNFVELGCDRQLVLKDKKFEVVPV
jgi:ATP phosphoribosyltransferase regulatory subunit